MPGQEALALVWPRWPSTSSSPVDLAQAVLVDLGRLTSPPVPGMPGRNWAGARWPSTSPSSGRPSFSSAATCSCGRRLHLLHRVILRTLTPLVLRCSEPLLDDVAHDSKRRAPATDPDGDRTTVNCGTSRPPPTRGQYDLRQRLGARARGPEVLERGLVDAREARQVGLRSSGSGARSASTGRAIPSSGTVISARSAGAGTSTIVDGSSATTVAVRRLPVRAAISPKKSPASIDDSERYPPSGSGVPAAARPSRMKYAASPTSPTPTIVAPAGTSRTVDARDERAPLRRHRAGRAPAGGRRGGRSRRGSRRGPATGAGGCAGSRMTQGRHRTAPFGRRPADPGHDPGHQPGQRRARSRSR